MSRALRTASLLVFWSIPGAVRAGASASFRAGTFEPPRAAPEFELRGSNGSPVRLSQYRGKVVALAFGFTYCPRICPVTLAHLSRAWEQLGPAASDAQVVFVTVDPERDTPERMHEFLSFFNPAFIGATGTARQLEAVNRDFGVTARRAFSTDKKLGYEVHHSSFVYLIDREGRLRLLMPFGKTTDDLVHDIKLLLNE